MKKFWKALGIAALAAAIPVRFKRDESTGQKKFQSLLISVDVGPNQEGDGTSIGINIGEGVLTNAISGLVGAKKETHLFADDDPAAAVLPVDDEPGPVAAEEPAEPADVAGEAVETVEATEEDFDPEG